MPKLLYIVYLQRQHFPMLFNFRDDKVSTKSLPRYLQKLCPNIIDGVARVGGRLSRALVDFEMKHPVILPQHSHFTELLIRQHHKEIGHSGASHTWAALRRRYWIIKGGTEVRKCIGKCILCRKRNASVSKQLIADLPNCRLQFDQPPFSSKGVDYFGPILVKQRRSIVKRYGCVFTCLTMRGVHIEIANSLDTDSFINALRRFIARRGRPRKSSATMEQTLLELTGSCVILCKPLTKIRSTVTAHNRTLNGLNPPTASHFGGAWERMIRSIRRILGGLLGNQTLNDENCLTLMAEVESILNSRPLVPISFTDLEQEPLTPNHLLLLRESPNLPPGIFSKDSCYLRRRWAQVQYLANQFWQRWIKEFLPNLHHRQKWFDVKRNLKVDDIVLLVEDSQQRSKWLMGRVLKTFPDKRGLVRTMLVKTHTNVFKRPIAKLCPILTAD